MEHYNCGAMTRRTGNVEILTEDVLLIHPDDANKEGAIRFSFSKYTTLEIIDYALKELAESIKDLDLIIKGR